MKDETKQLHRWYMTVQNDEDTLSTWADAVMSDPDNGVVYTRLAACAAASVEMMLRLAERDGNPETMKHVRNAMSGVLSTRPVDN